jgi:hypothetical protein
VIQKSIVAHRNPDALWSHAIHVVFVRHARKTERLRGAMNAEFDYDLTPDQWEALRAIRVPAQNGRALNRFVVENLVALGLAEITDDRPVITPKGRSVLLRGSPRLWDVAA